MRKKKQNAKKKRWPKIVFRLFKHVSERNGAKHSPFDHMAERAVLDPSIPIWARTHLEPFLDGFFNETLKDYCSFNNEEELIFLDVTSVSERNIKRAQSPTGETTLFGRNGEPVAYIAHNDEDTIYTFGGTPCAYIDDGDNIYGFNGRHLGWFEDGIVWNHSGRRVGFIKTSCPVFTSFEPFKGFKQFKPFKGSKSLAPMKPLKSMSNSDEGLLSFLEQGR